MLLYYTSSKQCELSGLKTKGDILAFLGLVHAPYEVTFAVSITSSLLGLFYLDGLPLPGTHWVLNDKAASDPDEA